MMCDSSYGAVVSRAIRLAHVATDGDLSGASGRSVIRLIRDRDQQLRWYGADGTDCEVSGATLAEAIRAAQDSWSSGWDLQWGRPWVPDTLHNGEA